MASIKSKDSKTLARCIRCKHSTLMQWFENPVVAECKTLHERFVAECDRQCKFFEPSGNDQPDITHYDHYEDNDNF